MANFLTKKRLLGLASTFLLTLGLADTSFAGAWVREEGDALLINRLGWYVSTNAYNQHYHKHQAPRYRELQLNPYIEYGLTDRMTIGTNIYILDIDPQGGSRRTGFGDVEFFARYLLWEQDSNVLSTQGLIKLPGNVSNLSQPFGGADQIDLEWRLLYGTSGRVAPTSSNFWWFDISAALRKRFRDPADEIRAEMSLGLKTHHERLWWVFREYNIWGLHNERHDGLDYDLFYVQPSVIYWTKESVGWELGIRHDFLGRDIGVGTMPYIGLWFRMD